MTEKPYTVTWTIDVFADEAATPREAAVKAWEHLRATGSIANVFDVRDNQSGESTLVDLTQEAPPDAD